MNYLAQVDISGLSYPGQKIQNSFNLGDLLTKGGFNVINFVFFLAGLIFFINLLGAGWEYLLSTGDQKKVASATTRFSNAVFGIFTVLASFVIIRIVLSVLGIDSI